MKTQNCKIGRTAPTFNKALSVEKLETKYQRYIEEAYNNKQLDASLSDYFYYEAAKLKHRIRKLKLYFTNTLDAAL